jgi:hypothetical protein
MSTRRLCWVKLVFLIVTLSATSSQIGLSQQSRSTTRRYNPKCQALQLGGNEQVLLDRLAESLGKRYQLKLVPWEDNAQGQRQFDLDAPNEDPTSSDRVRFAFGTTDEKVRGKFAATIAGSAVSLSEWFGPITVPEPKRTWVLAAAKITVSHYTGLDEVDVAPELEKLLKSAEAVNATESDLKRMAAGKYNPPVYEHNIGEFTVSASRIFSGIGLKIYRYSCR